MSQCHKSPTVKFVKKIFKILTGLVYSLNLTGLVYSSNVSKVTGFWGCSLMSKNQKVAQSVSHSEYKVAYWAVLDS